MTLYVFFRGTSWYPIDLRDDLTAIEHAHLNPGTTRVEAFLEDRLVWKAPEELKNAKSD